MISKELGIIGLGNMGSALLRGIIKSNVLDKTKVIICDINKTLQQERVKEFGVDEAENVKSLTQVSKYILIAVKPQVIDGVLGEIALSIKDQQIVISIAAGISISHLQQIIPNSIGIVRVMPNTPALIGAGASAICYNDKIKAPDLEFVRNLFEAVGLTVELDEKYMDIVTGLSGSGPAYFFIILEALVDGAVKMGLPRDIALKLATQTALGSARMVLETGKHPAQLKDMVTSPGGTTITALHELEKGHLRATIMSAVEAATLKAKGIK